MEIFDILLQAASASQTATDRSDRKDMTILAVCSNNNDPENQRRIKVSDPACPGVETHWLRRTASAPGYDLPLPELGQTVRVTFIDGDPTNGWYESTINQTNPPQDKKDPIKDTYIALPGERTTTIAKSDKIECVENLTIKVGKSIKLENFAGASIELTESGDIVIQDASGNKITLGSAAIAIRANDLTVGGKTIVTLGSVDTGGDVTITRGW